MSSDEDQLPKYLYKYADWGNEYHQWLLSATAVYFASPRRFNDPFDSSVLPNFGLRTDEEWRTGCKTVEERKNPSLGEEEVDKQAEKNFRERMWEDPDNIRNAYENAYKDVCKRFGIFCLSKTKGNLLLWSHYADQHRGFCIGYDRRALQSSLHLSNPAVGLCKVNYATHYPSLHPDKLSNEEQGLQTLTTKFVDWQYEQEYRFILVRQPGRDDPREYPIDRRALHSVILGLGMSDEHKQQIKEVLRQQLRHVRLFQARKSLYEFGLEFEPVEY